MKKKITRPDGTIEEYEGTAEEIAKIEESLKNVVDKKNDKKLLTDQVQKSDFDSLKKLLEDAKKTAPTSWPYVLDPTFKYPNYQWWDSTNRPCAIEEFFKNHPKETFVGLVCSCPRCMVYCGVTTNTTTSSNVPMVTDYSWMNNPRQIVSSISAGLN